jgi:hypothetical protein
MQRINVLSIQRISAEDRAKIEAVDPAIELTDAGGWYDGEIRETWPAFTTARYLAPGATGSGTREERDRLLAEAEVILGGWPFPLDLRARAPRLKWFHQRPAGASVPAAISRLAYLMVIIDHPSKMLSSLGRVLLQEGGTPKLNA